jgi:hypothetical protein
MAPNDYDDDDLSEDEDDDDEVEEAVAVPKKKRAGSKKDSTKPKRNMSAFFLYSQAFRAQVKEENSDVSFGDIVSQQIPFDPIFIYEYERFVFV